jgi:hypothetical protein
MKLVEQPGRSRSADSFYNDMRGSVSLLAERGIPYVRRVIRFLALPLLLRRIDWTICDKSKLCVLCDFLYIFFVLKYYPDNYFLCRLWTVNRKDWKYYYGSIYDPYQRRQFQRSIYRKENSVLFANKQVCYDLCKSAGIPLPRQFGVISPQDDYRSRIARCLDEVGTEGRIIIKPIDGMGGNGIVVCQRAGDTVVIKRRSSICNLADFELNRAAVVQEYLHQHPLLSRFSRSTNTIRLATLYKSDLSGVVLVGAFIRFGVGDSDIDNLSSGGLAVGIDIGTGRLYPDAIDFAGTRHCAHPDSLLPFKDFEIPYWRETTALGEMVQSHFGFHKFLGLDLCITEHGPVLVEINEEQDVVAMEMTYGPILKNKEVLKEFQSYGLCINRLTAGMTV